MGIGKAMSKMHNPSKMIIFRHGQQNALYFVVVDYMTLLFCQTDTRTLIYLIIDNNWCLFVCILGRQFKLVGKYILRDGPE